MNTSLTKPHFQNPSITHLTILGISGTELHFCWSDEAGNQIGSPTTQDLRRWCSTVNPITLQPDYVPQYEEVEGPEGVFEQVEIIPPYEPVLTDESVADVVGKWLEWQEEHSLVPKSSPVPSEVGAGQIRAALIASGVAASVSELDSKIEALLKGNEIGIALWKHATGFKRYHPLITSAGKALGKTEKEMDDLFRLAATF